MIIDIAQNSISFRAENYAETLQLERLKKEAQELKHKTYNYCTLENESGFGIRIDYYTGPIK